ncbi:hypothetical protein [Polyangium sp. 15x6]|uniref:hypothetical protein n=1 Tax=Polyangium sp. 15x6 TaxID=3042687 RepID=UPI00249A743D|nr:hypothetical protein [Polyangium sp. 15x6]MDI3284630.1 hypothetical protein [Polyangium sp. 15x6]
MFIFGAVHRGTKWAALEALAGADPRIARIASDLVEHFEARLVVMEGEAMLVCMSRRICADMCEASRKLIAAGTDGTSSPAFMIEVPNALLSLDTDHGPSSVRLGYGRTHSDGDGAPLPWRLSSPLRMSRIQGGASACIHPRILGGGGIS